MCGTHPSSSACGVAIFSVSQYVRDQMQPLVERWPDSKLIDCPCSASTAALAAGCHVACLFVNDDCSREVVAVFKRVGIRLVAMRCAGFDKVDVAALNAAGIRVVRVPAYSPYSVAEHAVTLAMCLNRKIQRAYTRVREGNFTLSGLVGFDMRGKTVGIVSTGRIGTVAARSFKEGLGMRVIGYDVHESDHFREIGEYVSLDELCAQADIISIHTPLMPSTTHMVNKELIAKMKDGVILVNTARGGIINTDDLIDGITKGKIDGAGLDKYEDEDAIFFQDLSTLSNKERMKVWDMKLAMLRALPNVIITPHSGFLTKEALADMCATTIANIEEFVEGKPLTNAVGLWSRGSPKA